MEQTDLASIRKDYKLKTFLEEDADKDPMQQFTGGYYFALR